MKMDGLEGFVAAETVLSDVDGERGRLIIRGMTLDQIAGRKSYEEVLALLLQGLVDVPQETAALREALGRARRALAAHLPAIDEALAALDPADALRALIARLPDGEDVQTALRLLAAPAVFTPALMRLREGKRPIEPDESLGHAADMLRMMNATHPNAAQAAALDAYLVTVCDHGLNASTFAARVVASTGSGLTSAVVAGLGALKGPLHGGAPGPVLDMLDAVGRPQDAASWVEQALAGGQRLMGFGHRIYRVRDPRADALRTALDRLAQVGAVDEKRLRLAEAVEAAALAALRRRKPQRRLETNVEFYTALLLEALGIPRSAFTCIFAAGRVGGWIAHAREQRLSGRLIRPQSTYLGPLP